METRRGTDIFLRDRRRPWRWRRWRRRRRRRRRSGRTARRADRRRRRRTGRPAPPAKRSGRRRFSSAEKKRKNQRRHWFGNTFVSVRNQWLTRRHPRTSMTNERFCSIRIKVATKWRQTRWTTHFDPLLRVKPRPELIVVKSNSKWITNCFHSVRSKLDKNSKHFQPEIDKRIPNKNKSLKTR